MTKPTLQGLTDEITKLSSFLETAQKLIHQGTSVEISALEVKVSNLCADLERLPPNEARGLVPSVENLLVSIDRLEKDLDMQHDAVTERLQLEEPHVSPLMAQEVTDDDDKD
jgi:hypothetical protein